MPSGEGIQSLVTERAGPRRHPTFYIEDEMVTIQAEDTLFKIHKQQLWRSETFRDMFDMGEQNSLIAEGSSIKDPIKLDGVSASDFESFLLALYSHECSKCHNQPFMKRTQFTGASRILPALRLADMWNFTHHRDYLLDLAFDTLDIIDRIVLAQQYNVQSRIKDSYLQLCQRHDPLTLDEARKIGLEGTAFVGRVRERLCRRVPLAPVRARPAHSQFILDMPPPEASYVHPEQLKPLPSGKKDEAFLEEVIQEWLDQDSEPEDRPDFGLRSLLE
ncbi:hypothetical protein FRC12_012226 [Ceratobasidium sp. 428]|nr:hypothetical protein FRC12_012226 [Ceratobasidium sp. 428]